MKKFLRRLALLTAIVAALGTLAGFISAKLTLADEPGLIHELELTEEQLRRMA